LIIFEKLEYCNLLSSGNKPIEIDLVKPITCIRGKNGSGKSTIYEAFMFALYGKSFRGINLPQMVNSINKKNLKSCVDFSIGERKYRVVRGIKPNIFEIYVDGVLKEPPSNIKDYQNWFEKSVLKMNIKTFKQIVVLGSSNYVPFMELSTADRRNVVEEILDIRIFTLMNHILKQRILAEKNKYDEIKSEMKILSSKISLIKEHINDIESRSCEVVDGYKEKIVKCKNCINEYNAEIDKIQDEIEKRNEIVSNIQDVQSRRQKFTEFKTKIQSSIRELKSKATHFNDNQCGYCQQSIDDDYKLLKLDEINQSMNNNMDGLNKAEKLIDKANDDINKMLDINKEIVDMEKKISKLNEKISGLNSIISLSQDKIEENEKIESTQSKQNELLGIMEKYESYVQDADYIVNETKYFSVAQTMMRDDGVKSQIVKQYIPVINKLIKKYMGILEFNCGFEFDENFNETIKSRGRDKFSYCNFSDGQKMRINLSLMFAFRELCKLKNSASCNLVIIDELGGTTLDSSGIDAFKKIVEESSDEKNNIMIITHDLRLVDSFPNVLSFSLNSNGFTELS